MGLVLYIVAWVVVAVVLTAFRPRLAAAFAVALTPWVGLNVDAGVTIGVAQIFWAVLLVYTFLVWFSRRSGGFSRTGWGWVGLALFAAVWTVFQAPSLPSDGIVSGGALRAPVARSLLQIVAVVIVFAPIPVLAVLAREIETRRTLWRTLFFSMVALTGLGWIQMGWWLASGDNILPIGWLNYHLGGASHRLSDAIFVVGGQPILRMNSLGGEPKSLGQMTALAVVLFIPLRISGREFVSNKTWMLGIMLMLGAVLGSFSTSAWLLLGVLGPLLVISTATVPRTASRGLLTGLTAAVVGLWLLLGIGAWMGYEIGVDPANVAEERTIGRSALIEDFDQAVGSWLVAEPSKAVLGVGLGNAHLYADPYLPSYAQRYASGTAFTAKSGALRVTSELGLVGLALFLTLVIWDLHRLRDRTVPHLRAESWHLQVAVLLSLVAFLLRGWYVVGLVAFCFGLQRAVGVRTSDP